MNPARTLPLLALVATLALPSAAPAAKPPGAVKIDAPAAGETTVVVASVGKRAAKAKPKLKATAPTGVAVLGGVTPSGRLAVAIARPRDAAKGGRVAVTVRARGKAVKAKGAKRVAAGAAACKDAKLGAALGRKVAGGVSSADAKALGAALGRRACGKPATAADTAVLDRLGLGAPPAAQPPAPAPTVIPPAATPGRTTTPLGGPSRPSQPGTGGGTDDGGGGTANQCSNGTDDDGDGQADFGTNPNVSRPDPGCASSTDDEAGEVAVSAECAQSSGVSRGDEDRNSAFAAINADCGEFTAYWINIAPGPIATCKSFTAESNFTCAVEQGDAVARSMDGKPTDMADTLIGMAGSFDCTIPATIALVRTDGSVAELVEPVGGCEGEGPAKAACENGVDDDGDGQIDAAQTAGAADPDPGCTSPGDGTEDSETGLPAGCTIGAGTSPENARVISVSAGGCGDLRGISFTPPGTPEVCVYQVGENAVQECSLVGATVSADFAATSQDVAVGTRLSDLPECGRLVTVALKMADGSVAELRDTWCE